jgi:hypothetical protein
MKKQLTGVLFATLATTQIAIAQAPQTPEQLFYGRQFMSKGLEAFARCKTGSAEFYFRNHRFPQSNAEMPVCNLVSDDAVKSIEIRPSKTPHEAEFWITYGTWAGDNNVLVMLVKGMEAKVELVCGAKGSTLHEDYLPSSCRGNR